MDQSRDLTGQKFGQLTPYMYEVFLTKNGKAGKWHCLCDCGNKVITTPFRLTHGDTTSCGCKKKQKGRKNLKYQGYQEISLSYWNNLMRGASSRNIPFEITIEYAWEVFEKQKGCCALTGEPLSFGFNLRDQKGNLSLDRINSNQGYLQGNIQWVLKEVNRMKNNLDETKFISFCGKIVEFSRVKAGELQQTDSLV